jgi:hypothetical protein
MDFGTILQAALLAVIAIVIPPVVRIVYAWAKGKLALLAVQIPARELDLLRELTPIAIQYAEKIGADLLSEEKLQTAVEYIQANLEHLGIKLDVKIIIGAIEAALQNGLQDPPAPTPMGFNQ